VNLTFRPKDRPTMADRGRPLRNDEFGYFLQIRRHEPIGWYFTEELFAVDGLGSLTIDGRENGNRSRKTAGPFRCIGDHRSSALWVDSVQKQCHLTWLENRLLTELFQSRICVAQRDPRAAYAATP